MLTRRRERAPRAPVYRPPGPRFLRSMPLPLMVLFLALVAATLGLVAWIMISPPNFGGHGVFERRPPAAQSWSHDVQRLREAPIVGEPGVFDPPCETLATTKIEGGTAAVGRLNDALRTLCRLDTPQSGPELREALQGLRGATIRFAAVFGLTGVESTADVEERRIWLNLRFARANAPTVVIAPLVVHEAYHLTYAGEPVTARRELAARKAELEACRALIPKDRWPRGCLEADEIVGAGDAEAIRRLVAAGFPAR